MIQQLTFHEQKPIPVTSIQDLDLLPYSNNVHVSVLSFEMTGIEPDEHLTPLTWKPWVFFRHIKCRTNDDRFPISLWEV